MEAQYTTPFVTPNDTPIAIDRLRAELARLTDHGTRMIRAGHRALARAIGCSASRIPTLMRRLEAAGEIEREPCKNSYTVRLINKGRR